MEYNVTMLTVGQPIGSASSGSARWVPWSNSSGEISFNDPVLSEITLIDDDTQFESGRYTPDETMQTLAQDVAFNPSGPVIPAGTQLSNYLSSIIRETTPNPDGSFNEFLVLFPRSFTSGGLGSELGDRYSVLIFPKTLPNGEQPVFDPTKGYRYVGLQSIGSTNDAVDYPAQDSAPCFAAGTLIATTQGARRIEDLAPGDLILTSDHGPCPIRWIGATLVDAARLDLQPNLRPILIRAGAIGDGLPARDLVVSPQHRILIRSRIARRLLELDEALVAAKHLVGLPGIEVLNPPQGVTYYHMLFDRHELVLSNGAWTESLYTGPQAMNSVGAKARREILTLFPELAQAGFRPAGARRFLTGREARQLVQRFSRNTHRRLIEPL
ncbi:Hint domain-containing protein [Paracoccus fistulariae]|nr:Hint domain-containing protein [Paracoccus fistulariae]MDB6181521.1 Hint domain-containing protein [Paracoccus fistulariae]